MLEESVCDLQSTMCELQERLHSVDGEGEVSSGDVSLYEYFS